MDKIVELRKRIVQAAYNANEGHIPSALSVLDIVWTLYDSILKPEDRFVLSKGHGCLALYAVLEEKGIIPKGELDNFCQPGGMLGGHPDRNKVPGVLASTGSLGHGLSIATGIALAKKIKYEQGRVFCLVGDGELNEGSNWEACLLASHHELHNLYLIVDHNHSTDRALGLGELKEKFTAFGFLSESIKVQDLSCLKYWLRQPSLFKPRALVVETTKGCGVQRMKEPEWHHKIMTEKELFEILGELNNENNTISK